MSENLQVYIILLVYIGLTFITSLLWRRGKADTPEAYFLANRGLSTLTLFFHTFIATNFSAFFFLGFSGAGYRIGYSYYAMMAIGTAFAAISFYLIGNKAWHWGKTRGYITPVELIYDQSKSRSLKYFYLAVMIFFTLPYLALQPIGAGYILSNLTGGEISYFTGASLLTGFIIIYVFIGGMRSVANTDVKQGFLMIILMLAAVLAVAAPHGGLLEGHRKVLALEPGLFTRQGLEGYFTPRRWFSFCILWVACIPMFPQLFMRFFISKDLRTFKRSTVLYAAIPSFLFILPVAIGVLGHIDFPGLGPKEADEILPMMLVKHTPHWFAALVMTGALAAFMSTVDSQLLALSTLFTRDIYLPLVNPDASLKKQVAVGRIMVVLFALIGLAIAYRPFDTLFDIVRMAFTGYAVLFPVTLAVMYWKRVNGVACAVAIVAGELLLSAYYFDWIPDSYLFGFEPVVPVLGVTGLIIILSSLFRPGKRI